jgi:hypothetical protein
MKMIGRALPGLGRHYGEMTVRPWCLVPQVEIDVVVARNRNRPARNGSVGADRSLLVTRC